MSYAIIRNENYKLKNLSGIYRHNERKNTNYSNKDINRENSTKNYSIKQPFSTYDKVFKTLKKQYNLKGQIKSVSNVMCEYIITSDKEFFNSIGEQETRRYFETAYKFVANYQNLGEEFIVSAKVHNDESTPHLHLVFIPVVHKLDTKSGKVINKIACSEFWKGKDSYKKLQDNFYDYMTKAGFDLERGNAEENKHRTFQEYKKLTNYEVNEMFKETKHLEQEVKSDDIEVIKKDYKRIITKFNTLAKRYVRVKDVVDEINSKMDKLQEENIELEKENNRLLNYIDKTFEYVSLLFDFSKDQLHRLVNDFISKLK